MPLKINLNRKILVCYLLLSNLNMCSAIAQEEPIAKKRKIKARVDSLFTYSIRSDLGKGYQWRLMDTQYIKVLNHNAISSSDISKSSDIEIFTLKGIKKGRYKVTFYYLRPFDKYIDTLITIKKKQLIIIK